MMYHAYLLSSYIFQIIGLTGVPLVNVRTYQPSAALGMEQQPYGSNRGSLLPHLNEDVKT